VSCNPPIATLGETSSASQVLLKGPVVRVCWCTVRVEPWVFPCANVHEILFAGVHKELYEWLAILVDTQFEIRSRPLMVWTTMLINKVKRINNVVSRVVDLWFDNTIGGYINKFSIDKVESYSQVERYLFKGPRGKFLHFLKRKIKMLLHEKNILKI
jgi:hypothetical protein